jgi:ribosomal protein S18 acetylase RimI-like enzyme
MSHISAARPILPSRTLSSVQPRAGVAAILPQSRNAVHTQPHPTAIQPRAVVSPIVAPRSVVQPKPILASPPGPIAPPARAAQVPMPPVPSPRPPSPALQRSTSVSVSTPIPAGGGRYRIEASAHGRPVGSLMVQLRNHGAAEVTDLNVDQSSRGQGIGKALLGSAARAALQYGKGRVALASQDNGSGKLTGWYRGMGFRQVGVNQRGFPELEAPVSRVLSGLDRK